MHALAMKPLFLTVHMDLIIAINMRELGSSVLILILKDLAETGKYICVKRAPLLYLKRS